MKKFFRNLFSGTFLIILVLILELGVIIFIQFFLDDVLVNTGVFENLTDAKLWIPLIYVLVKLIGSIIAFFIFFKILNKAENPEFKIPWLVGMLLLPFFTSVMYLIFGNHGLSKRDQIITTAQRNAYNSHFILNKELKEEYLDELGQAAGTFKYINSTTLLGVHKHNRVTYYKNGETFFPALMEDLKKAKKFIFMEFFIISDGKLWTEVQNILIEKAKEGVDVRIVYDDMGCSGTISHRTPQKLAKYGIQAFKFHPFKPILSGVFNNRDHRKIVIIDHQCAYTGGINLADEYANIIKRFGYWKDTMVKIEGSAISNLLVTFLQNFNLCTGIVSDYNKYLNHHYEKYEDEDEGFVMPFGDGPGGIDNALIGEQNYVNMLNFAKKSVYISTPYLVPTYGLIDAMRNAALRGVDVHLILPGIPDKKAVYAVAKSNFKYLMDSGVHIHIYKPGFNHMKSMLVDNKLAFVGTINFDFRSLVHHFECGTLLYKTKCIKDIKEDFDEMISVSTLVPKTFKMNIFTRAFCSLIKLFTPLL